MKTVIFAGLFACLAAPVFAHASLETQQAEAGSYYKAVMRVPHGCEAQDTLKLTITLPDGIYSVKPMPKADWKLATTVGDYATPYDNHGTLQTAGVREIVWEGALPSDYYDEFTFRGKLGAELEEGDVLHFKTVQQCADGSVEWVEIAAPGADRPRRPAPSLTILPAEAHAGH